MASRTEFDCARATQFSQPQRKDRALHKLLEMIELLSTRITTYVEGDHLVVSRWTPRWGLSSNKDGKDVLEFFGAEKKVLEVVMPVIEETKVPKQRGD